MCEIMIGMINNVCRSNAYGNYVLNQNQGYSEFIKGIKQKSKLKRVFWKCPRYNSNLRFMFLTIEFAIMLYENQQKVKVVLCLVLKIKNAL